MSDKKERKDRGDKQKRKMPQSGMKEDVRGVSERGVRRGMVRGFGKIDFTTVIRDFPSAEEGLLLGEIALTIRRISELLTEAHADDKEIQKLGEETRRFLAETKREMRAA